MESSVCVNISILCLVDSDVCQLNPFPKALLTSSNLLKNVLIFPIDFMVFMYVNIIAYSVRFPQ